MNEIKNNCASCKHSDILGYFGSEDWKCDAFKGYDDIAGSYSHSCKYVRNYLIDKKEYCPRYKKTYTSFTHMFIYMMIFMMIFVISLLVLCLNN